jgi:hypothetical protein
MARCCHGTVVGQMQAANSGLARPRFQAHHAAVVGGHGASNGGVMSIIELPEAASQRVHVWAANTCVLGQRLPE